MASSTDETREPQLSASSIYHVTIDPELVIRWDPKAARAFFDDTNKELILTTPSGEIKRCSVDGTITKKQYQMTLDDVKNLKFSPDGSYITLQRNDADIEFYNTLDHSRFRQPIKTNPKVDNKILGFYWTNPTNLIVITRQGVELFALSKLNTLSRVNEFKVAINWFIYSAQLRILLLSTGPKENIMQGLHFKLQPNKWLQLPKFTINLSSEKELLREKDVSISLVYSKVYCIHAYTKQRELHLYHLTTDAVKKQLVIDLHATGQCHISVIDNLIVVHNVSQRVSMIFDINARHPKDNHISFPLAAPLPLAPTPFASVELYEEWVFALPRHAIDFRNGFLFSFNINLDAVCLSFSDRIKLVDFLVRRTAAKEMLISALRQMIEEKEPLITIAQVFDMLNDILLAFVAADQQRAATAPPAALSPVPERAMSPGPLGSDSSLPMSPPLQPRSAAAHSSAAGSSPSFSGSGSGQNSPVLSDAHADDLSTRRTEYFRNEYRKQQALKMAAQQNPSAASAASQTTAGVEQLLTEDSTSAPVVTSSASLAGSIRNSKTIDGKIVMEQDDMYTQVFVAIEEKRSVDAKTMVAVIGEYIRSLSFHRLQVHSYIYELIIDLLVRNNRFYQLHQLLQYHVVSDSIHVACQLLSLASSYPPAMQLSLDMFKRLGEPAQIIEILLSQGMLLHAMRFLKSLPLATDARQFVGRFLSEARRVDDLPLFFIAFNFFKQRNEIDPKECGDHIVFYNLKNQISDAPVSPLDWRPS